MTNADELLLLSIITAYTGCDINTAFSWIDAMIDRLEHAASFDQFETIGELERFVVDFLADYNETGDQ